MPITDLQRPLLRLPGGPDAHFARPTANEIHAKLCPRPAECKTERLFGTNWRKVPSWVGIRRFLLEIDENELESAIRTHAHGVASPPAGRQFIAIDGKALRGSASRVLDIPARQLVSAFDHDDLIVLGHVEVEDKSNEIPAAQALIESMGLPGGSSHWMRCIVKKNANARLGKGSGRTGAGQGQLADITCRMRRSGASLRTHAMRRSARQGTRSHRDTHRAYL
jgi:hypothetical protein